MSSSRGAPSHLPYFAYGSNMLFERIRSRVPSARVIGSATLEGYELRFNKRSKDGSGKANIVPSADPLAVVHGVLYEINETERAPLDRAEGLGKGYEIHSFRVRRRGTEAEAFAYMATPSATCDELKPYNSYKELVIAGATENRLPEDYVRRIEAVEAAENPARD